MRRADRLFLIIHALRGRRTACTARQLAQTLQVSLRTVYRDVADLQTSGIPIEGEAGVGYVLRKGADIPPLMFNAEELEALVVGTRFVRAFAGRRLGLAVGSAMLKIEAVLPSELRQKADRSAIYAPVWNDSYRRDFAELIDRLHEAIDTRSVLRFAYLDKAGVGSQREVEPLCLAFWGGNWTLGAWCHLRKDFRNFRPDRIAEMEVTHDTFNHVASRGLNAHIAAMRDDHGSMQ